MQNPNLGSERPFGLGVPVTDAPTPRNRISAARRLAVTTRWHPDDAERLGNLRQELAEAKIREAIERAVAKAPPLTPERRARLAALLSTPPSNQDEADAGRS